MRGALLAVGGHDHHAAAVGAGVAGEGEVLDSWGTAEAWIRATAPLAPEQVRDCVAAGITVGWHAVEGRQYLLGAARSGAALQTVVDLLGSDPSTLDAAALDADPAGIELRGLPDGPFTVTGPVTAPGAVYRAAHESLGRFGAGVLARMDAIAGPRTRLVVTGGWAEGETARAVKASHLGPVRARARHRHRRPRSRACGTKGSRRPIRSICLMGARQLRARLRSMETSTTIDFPLPGAGEPAVAVPAPGAGPGYWAGAPSAVLDDDGSILLAYRVRNGHDGNDQTVVARSADGVSFETLVVLDESHFDAMDVERPSLVRTDDGWRLYVCCAIPLTKAWWIGAIDAPTIEGLATAEVVTAFAPSLDDAVKDPIVRRDRRPLGGVDLLPPPRHPGRGGPHVLPVRGQPRRAGVGVAGHGHERDSGELGRPRRAADRRGRRPGRLRRAGERGGELVRAHRDRAAG